MKVTIWIRVEDKDKWLAIKNRPEFIHNALNPEMLIIDKDNFNIENVSKAPKPIKQEPHKTYPKKPN